VALDAANCFNPYALARVVHRGRLDRGLLARVVVSRAFTCHQLEALVRERLDEAVRRHRADRVIVLDPGALLYDGEIAPAEAARVAERIAAALERFSGAPAVVAMQEPPPSRVLPFEIFFTRAREAVRARASGSGWEMQPMKGARHGTNRSDVQPGPALGAGRAGKIPPRPAPRGPGDFR
jgi:hypothetical protein